MATTEPCRRYCAGHLSETDALQQIRCSLRELAIDLAMSNGVSMPPEDLVHIGRGKARLTGSNTWDQDGLKPFLTQIIEIHVEPWC